MTASNAEKLHRYYDQCLPSDQVLIITNADPDSIASTILWRRVASVNISNINHCSKPDGLRKHAGVFFKPKVRWFRVRRQSPKHGTSGNSS